MSGLAFAGSQYLNTNVDILGPNYGQIGQSPPVQIIRVSVGSEDNVAIGTVMVWDLSNSVTDTDGGLAFRVRVCDINSASGDADGDTGQFTQFAGVMVTTASRDSSDSEYGYMAIKGFCDASISYSDAKWKGRPLVMTGNNIAGTLGTVDGHAPTARVEDASLSEDIGILLENVGTDPQTGVGQLRKVWLN